MRGVDCFFLECGDRVTALICIIMDDALHIFVQYSRIATIWDCSTVLLLNKILDTSMSRFIIYFAP